MATIAGSAWSESIAGTAADDWIQGLGGDDTITGGDGDDLLLGGDGADVVHGGAGADQIAGSGYDPDPSPDVVFGDEGDDRILVGPGDTAFGGGGDDTFTPDSRQTFVGAHVKIDGGPGKDTLSLDFIAPFTLYLDQGANDSSFEIRNVEDITLGDGGWTVHGGSGSYNIRGGSDSDLIYGGDGPDSINGSGGSDTIIGGEGDDTLEAGFGTILLDGGEGNDTLTEYAGDATLSGGAGFDIAVLSYHWYDWQFTATSYGWLATSTTYPDLGAVKLESIEDAKFVDGLFPLHRVTGTDSNDMITTERLGDTIDTYDGNDTIKLYLRGVTIDGGEGVDRVVYSEFSYNYGIYLLDGVRRVGGGHDGQFDSLISIEDIQFRDGVLTFDAGSTAAQIVRLYDSFLGRAPDAYGYQSYLRFIAAGHSFQDMADSAAASAEFHDATAGLSDADYIAYVYQHSLHRAPDPYGLQQYEAALADGSLTRTSLIVQAAESPEHVALTAGVVAAGLWIADEQVESLELLYDAAVRRQPDEVGLKGYGDLIASGTSYRQIANDMSNSAEFLTAHAGQDDAAFVDSLYVAEVGRHADPGGLAAYADQLAHGYTRGDVLWETAFSLEHQGRVLAFVDPLLG